MEAFQQVSAFLPPWLRETLACLSKGTQADLQEIRLRTGQPVMCIVNGTASPCAGQTLTQPQLEEALFSLCGGALYAHEDELAQGFLSLPGGHRVGVAGSYVRLETGQIALQKAQALNIRLAGVQRLTLPPALLQLAETPFSTLLIGGQPGSGKTTILRALAVWYARRGLQCAVIDERGELFPPQAQRLACCDCIRGLAKPIAIQMALRTLAPQLLFLDELVSREEIAQLQTGALAGVQLVFTIHAGSMEELLQKPQVRQLQACHMLDAVCVLAGRQHPGQVQEVRRCCGASARC